MPPSRLARLHTADASRKASLRPSGWIPPYMRSEGWNVGLIPGTRRQRGTSCSKYTARDVRVEMLASRCCGAREHSPSFPTQRPTSPSATSMDILVSARSAPRRSLPVWKSTSASGARRWRGCPGSVERRGTGIATPSSRRRVDCVEDDAAIQHERAVKFESTQATTTCERRGGSTLTRATRGPSLVD